MASPRTLSCSLLLAWVVTGCHKSYSDVSDAGSPRPAASDAHDAELLEQPRHSRPETPSTNDEPDDPVPPPVKAGAMIRIDAGVVLAGSLPGTPGRNPAFEMDNESVEVGAFEIDVLPYPNDPLRPPLTEVTWEKAAQLCGEAGKRLCHELEWELACEGTKGRMYPYGRHYDEARYQRPQDVAGASGVRAMGTVGEWTLGPFVGGGADKALRGPAGRGGDAATRRCAQRDKNVAATETDTIGFRCCRGPAPQDLTYQTPTKAPPWNRRDDLTELDAFRAMIRSVPELEELHDDPRPFTREELFHVRHLSQVPSEAVPQLTWKVLQWTPDVGEELLVATGIDGRDGFVAVLYQLPGGQVRHAASYVLIGDNNPIMLGYTSNPRHVQWLPCMGCRDGGVIEIENGRVVISQRW